MYASPFDAERFPESPAIPEPIYISAEAATVLQQLRSTRPNPLDWNTATPIEKSTALARAIFDHEAARLTLDLPDDRMDLPVALHMDDPRLLQLLDTARQIQQRNPAEWPMLMDMALEAVQAETADVMGLDVDGLDARDLDNQNMPLYETIHEDMLDHRLETRYQGILNPGTLAAPVTTPWMPPAPGTYLGVLPVRPSPLPNPSPQEVITPPAEPWTLAGTPSAGMPPAGMPESPTFLAQPQPQPQRQRSAIMPDYQIREVTDPETQAVTYRAMMVGIPENRGTLSRIWASTAQNDELPVGEFVSQAAAQEHIRWLRSDEMNGLREQIRQAQPVTIAGVPYEPILNDDGGLSHYIVSDSLQRTDMPMIAPWELQQYLHIGNLSPEMATQQWQNAASAGYEFTATERAALQRFARESDADPQFQRYRAQEGDYLLYLGGSRENARKFSLGYLPGSVQTFVQENRFVPDPAIASNVQATTQTISEPVERPTNADPVQGPALRQESPASARTLQAAALQTTVTETGLHLQDLYLPDAHRKPMRIDTAFRESDFIRAFFNTSDALSFMGWVDAQKEQRAALDRGEPLTLGQLRYVPAGVPGEYRATDAETGQPIDRQIIDQSSLHDLLHNGVVRDDLAQQWQLCPDLLTPILQTIVDHRQKGMYDYASVADEISRYAPSPQTQPAQPVSSIPQNPPASPAQVSAQPSPAAGNFAPSAAEQQAQVSAANPQDMDYKDESTAGAAAPAKQGLAGKNDAAPVEQEKTQEAQQKGREWQQKGREGQQKDRTSQQGNQAANDGQNQKGQGQGTSSNSAGQDAPKSGGGFSLFSRAPQHHHYNEEKKDTTIAPEAFAPGAALQAAASPGTASPDATPPGAALQAAAPPEVSKRETLGVLNGMNQVPLSPEEINVMRHRVEKEGLTPEIQKGIENLSARGQQDVKDGKLTPEQIQKNTHAINQLGDTVNRQPDSPQKDSVLEHIRKLVGMLVEALKRIFSRGRASAGPGMAYEQMAGNLHAVVENASGPGGRGRAGYGPHPLRDHSEFRPGCAAGSDHAGDSRSVHRPGRIGACGTRSERPAENSGIAGIGGVASPAGPVAAVHQSAPDLPGHAEPLGCETAVAGR